MADEYEELMVLQAISNEARMALNDKSMTIDDSNIAPQLKKTLQTGKSEALEFKDYAAAFGIALIPLPLVGIVGPIAYLAHKKKQKKKIQNEKLSI